MPDEILRALLDPTAPLPTGWPSGIWGAFLLFMIPIGGGIPMGVLMAREGGASPPLTALLYLATDVIQAVVTEPLLVLGLSLGGTVPFLRRIGEKLSSLTHRAGFNDAKRGRFSLIMVSLAISPLTARTAAAAAGHGSVAGWSFAIAGDMLYFGMLMISTLWLSTVFGDERLTVGVVLVLTILLPTLLRRWQARRVAPEPFVASTGTQLQTAPPLAQIPAAKPAGSRSRQQDNRGRRRHR